MDISPTGISHVRYIFWLFGCFAVPLGWVLGNLFLYLYFKFDDGYFSGVKMEFRYNDDICVRNRNLTRSKIKFLSIFNRCVYGEICTKPMLNKYQHDVMAKLDKNSLGQWVDLESEENHFQMETTELLQDEEEPIEFVDIEETKSTPIEEIRNSIPYYRESMSIPTTERNKKSLMPHSIP